MVMSFDNYVGHRTCRVHRHLTKLAGKFREARQKVGLPEALVLYCADTTLERG